MKRRKISRNLHNSSTRQKNNTLDLIDRISSLPDSILGPILSYLPTKNAVATTILSKRWKLVWMTVDSLDFCLEDCKNVLAEDEDMKFVQFVNRVLLLHDGGSLNKFRLVWCPRIIPSQLSTWIHTAISRNLHELYVSVWNFYLPNFEAFQMPASVFSSDSLQCLELEGSIYVPASIVVCLPRLESLKLVSVNFQSEEAFEKLICGCPMLNYLHLEINMDEMTTYYKSNDDFKCIISSTSLRRLELWVESSEYDCTLSLQLEASSLEYLKLCGRISRVFVQGCLNSLFEADFRIEFWEDELPEDICNSVVKAIRAFNGAKALTLSIDAMWALSKATVSLSTKFSSLTKLKAEVDCCYCSLLQDFIQSSDVLEVLTVSKEFNNPKECNHDHSKWIAPVEVPRCLSNSLKTVAFKEYGGYDDEREMIGYMLKHGSGLEVIHVTCTSSAQNMKEVYLELVKEIRRFPRKSPACKVEFIE